jgi:hypothetical protein
MSSFNVHNATDSHLPSKIQSGTLASAPHTLEMAVHSCTPGIEAVSAVWLDFVVYQPSPIPTSTTAVSAPTPPRITAPAAVSTVTSEHSSSLASVCPASDAAALQRAHLTVIVLAVTLGLIPLLASAIAAGAFIQRKGWRSTKQRRIRSWFSSEQPPEYNERRFSTHHITPFEGSLGGVAVVSTVSPAPRRGAK